MPKPILHERTATSLNKYLLQPAHGLIVSGKEGIGKKYIALWLASELKMAPITITTPEDKNTISIDQIRELYRLTRTGNGYVVIIEDAHRMGVDAQNSFLKLLEEPPKNTRFILTTKSLEGLLPTIRSRCQTVEIIAPKKQDLLERTGTDASIISLLHTTEGMPGSFFTQLADKKLLDQHQKAVDEAKQFYSSDIYNRHLMLTKAKYDASYTKKLLSLLAIIIQSLLEKNVDNNKTKRKLISQAELIEATTVSLTRINGNPKIHLTKLATEL